MNFNMKFFVLSGLFMLLFLIPSAAASVVISEVLYDAEGSDEGQEFVELYNPTAQDVDITGWKLEWGNGNYTDAWETEVTFEATLHAYSFYLVGEENVTGADIVADLDLQNGPDAVRIVDENDQIMDLVGYGEESDFNNSEYYEGTPMYDVQEGHSIERKPGFEDPLHGNGQDTDNNIVDFLDRETPEPQNSSVMEIPVIIVVMTRAVSPEHDFYTPGTEVTVTLLYSFYEPQIGFILRETNPLGIENANPEEDYENETSGLSKWLLRDRTSIPNGTITYTFLVPGELGEYTIRGEWQSIDSMGTLHFGTIGDTFIYVLSGILEGFVEDVLGISLANALVTLDNESTTTNESGYYALTMPAEGEYLLNASKEGYLSESVIINISEMEEGFFNFTGDCGLIPEHVSDTEILQAVLKWAEDFIGDEKMLEVVHQWAHTPE